MGLMGFLRELREADKLAAVLKSKKMDGHEEDACAIRRTWRVYRKVDIARIAANPRRPM
jgi:hypothetical protein